MGAARTGLAGVLEAAGLGVVEGGGGERVGYLRAAFEAVVGATLLTACAALDGEEPMLVPQRLEVQWVRKLLRFGRGDEVKDIRRMPRGEAGQSTKTD